MIGEAEFPFFDPVRFFINLTLLLLWRQEPIHDGHIAFLHLARFKCPAQRFLRLRA